MSTDGFASVDSIFDSSELFVALSSPREQRAALEFDISLLPPAGEFIVSASLVLHFTIADLLVGVHAAAGDGAISEADFLFDNLITTFDPVAGAPSAENVVDVTGYIQSAAGVDAFVVFQLRELFDHPTVAELAVRLASAGERPRLPALTPSGDGAARPLSFAQRWAKLRE